MKTRFFPRSLQVVMIVAATLSACDNAPMRPTGIQEVKGLSSDFTSPPVNGPTCGEAVCSVAHTTTTSYFSGPNCTGNETMVPANASDHATWDGYGTVGHTLWTVAYQSYRMPYSGSWYCWAIGGIEYGHRRVYRANPVQPCNESTCAMILPQFEPYRSSLFTGENCTGTEYHWPGNNYYPLNLTASWDGQGQVGVVSYLVTILTAKDSSGVCQPFYYAGWGPIWATLVHRTNATPLSATISGPDYVRPTAFCEWYVTPSGGKQPYNVFYWSGVASSPDLYQDVVYGRKAYSGTIRVVVTDYDGHGVEATKFIQTSPQAPPC